MKISVIIPTYKPQDYLWDCLDSIVAQTFSKDNFEVILVLNGCTEPYKSAIEKYIAERMKGMNVNFIHTEKGGVSNARNLALDQVKGEFVAFIDDDDFISQTYLKELYQKASPSVISLCYPLSFIDGTNNYKPYLITQNYEDNKDRNICNYKYAKKYFSGPVYKLIHKDVIGHKRFDVRFQNGEDALFMFYISNKFQNVAFTSKNAVYYRRIRSNSAVSRKEKARKVIANVFKLIGSYTAIYFKNPNQYSLFFYVTRILGTIRWGVKHL